MSKELNEIDEKLTNDTELKKRQTIGRDKMWMDFNLLSTKNPRETNRIIFKVIIFAIIVTAAYLISFYF